MNASSPNLMGRDPHGSGRAPLSGPPDAGQESQQHTDATREAGTVHDFTATTIEGEQMSLARFRGQLLLIVNTASRCVFTRQFEDLEDLQERYGPHGFTVLGFPSDQFHQELGTDQEIEDFCTAAYDVSFPLFSKVRVNGPDAHPLWAWLQTQKGGIVGGRISWNFTKFLIDTEGRVLRRYAPPVPPTRIARRVEHELDLPRGRHSSAS